MRFHLVGAAIALLASGLGGAVSAGEGMTARIMTQNMDEGTTFQELVTARTPQEFVIAVTRTYQNILATRPAERAGAMAREIANQRPDVVGLQEASIVRTGIAGPATKVESDLLQSLLDSLKRLGTEYRVVAIVPGLDAQAPSTLGFNVRLTTQDAILVRADDRDKRLNIDNVQVHQFTTNLNVMTPIGPITLPRGWASVDFGSGDGAFRFVTTHLDVTPSIQLAQMNELLSRAINTNLPVVLAGDFNTDASNPSDPSFPTYQAAIAAGFDDAWLRKHSKSPGFTCCQDSGLLNTPSSLDQRIDLVLIGGAFRVARIGVVGDRPDDRTMSGMWPSDHAGVAVELTWGGH